MVYTDSHIHIAEIDNWQIVSSSPVCACAHTVHDFLLLEKLAAKSTNEITSPSKSDNKKLVVKSFGVHPQNPDSSLLPFLEKLLRENRIDVIGETGFDLFSEEFKLQEANQEFVWQKQLELASQYNKPIVVHCRKALHKIFVDSKKLSHLPAVIFHSFPGTPIEAMSLLKRNINGFFVIGKQVLNGNKKVIDCAKSLPFDRLLAETDAPYQTLKGEKISVSEDIIRVYNEIALLRQLPIEKVCNQFDISFSLAFNTGTVLS